MTGERLHADHTAAEVVAENGVAPEAAFASGAGVVTQQMLAVEKVERFVEQRGGAHQLLPKRRERLNANWGAGGEFGVEAVN